jgi:hypothetical protein
MSAFGSKADITATEPNFNLGFRKKLRQLGDIRHPPRAHSLALGELPTYPPSIQSESERFYTDSE